MLLTDIFKIKKFKSKITDLENKELILNEQLTDLKGQLTESIDEKSEIEKQNLSLKEQLKEKLTIKQMEPYELDSLIKSKKDELDRLISDKDKELNKLITDKKTELKSLELKLKTVKKDSENIIDEINKNKKDLENIKADISDLTPSLEMSGYGIYEPQYDFATALEYKDQLTYIREQQKDMIKSKSAVSFNPNWVINDSKAEGRKMNRNNIKAILRSFNNECTDAINKVTYSNIDRIKTRIIHSFEQHNKLHIVDQIEILPEYLNLKLNELHLAFEYKQKVQEEKEILREERDREREEKILQREIENQKKVINKEINHYSKAIEELNTKLQIDSSNKELLEEIENLKKELATLHEKSEEVDYRESNATSGYVYIISNIGSFGKNTVKIGVTRRLDPTERIKELSSASVPFKFDIHALIFSEDAYSLETELHKKFDSRRINKVNNRKEYFSISIDEIENELKNYKNLTVNFNRVPEADEYKQTQELINSKLKIVEDTNEIEDTKSLVVEN